MFSVDSETFQSFKLCFITRFSAIYKKQMKIKEKQNGDSNTVTTDMHIMVLCLTLGLTTAVGLSVLLSKFTIIAIVRTVGDFR